MNKLARINSRKFLCRRRRIISCAARGNYSIVSDAQQQWRYVRSGPDRYFINDTSRYLVFLRVKLNNRVRFRAGVSYQNNRQLWLSLNDQITVMEKHLINERRKFVNRSHNS